MNLNHRASLCTLLVPIPVLGLVPYLLRKAVPTFLNVNLGVFSWLGLGLIAIGGGVVLAAIWEFARAGRGTLAPIDPPKKFVATGLYRFVRNPMYVGVISVLIGQFIWFGNGILWVFAVLMFFSFHSFVVFYEEPNLRKRFEEPYSDCCRRVNRWIPRIPDKI